MAILFKQQQKSRNMTDIEKDVEKLELMFLKKIKPRITIWFSNSTSGYIPKRSERKDSNMCSCVHGAIIHISQNMEVTPVSSNQCMNKIWHTVEYYLT